MRTHADRERLFEANRGLVCHVIRRCCLHAPRPYEADDLFAAGLLGLWDATRCWDAQRGEFATYAFRAIRNACIKWLRDTQRGNVEAASIEALAGCGEHWGPTSPCVEEEAVLRAAVAALPAEDRELIRLLEGGWSLAEVARRRGYSRERARQRRVAAAGLVREEATR